MGTKLYDYEGIEFDWFLMDGKRRVALCSSAGFGKVPVSVLDGLTEDNLPMYEIPKIIEKFSVLGGHSVEGQGPGKCKEFEQLANRGFFVFGWKHWKGPYERIMVPEVRLSIDKQSMRLLGDLRAVFAAELDFERLASFKMVDLGIDF